MEAPITTPLYSAPEAGRAHSRHSPATYSDLVSNTGCIRESYVKWSVSKGDSCTRLALSGGIVAAMPCRWQSGIAPLRLRTCGRWVPPSTRFGAEWSNVKGPSCCVGFLLRQSLCKHWLLRASVGRRLSIDRDYNGRCTRSRPFAIAGFQSRGPRRGKGE